MAHANSEEDSDPYQYLKEARRLIASGKNADAFDLYLKAVNKCPEIREDVETECRTLLTKLNLTLAISRKVGDIFSNFEKAIRTFPGNVELLNDVGQYLYRYGYYREACCHFQKALYADCSYVSAEKNLNSLKNYLVERWHFRMLNDKVRNEAFQKALHNSITINKDVVVDIGAGVGLLSMYARECKPLMVTAVESSEAMAEVAENVIYVNDAQPVIMVNKLSTGLDDNDITGKCSIIVTEVFDAGLFGEHVLQTLVHAHQNLGIKGCRVIPARAEFFVAGIKSDIIQMKYQLSKSAKALLNIPTHTIHISTVDTYDCADVDLVKDVIYMTEPQSLLKVNFESCEDLQKKLSRSDPYQVNLKAKESGEVNIIIGWFNLHLTDDIMITTDPMATENRAKAWQQVVFFDFLPKTVKKNQNINLKFSAQDGKLALLHDFVQTIDRISPEALRFLNDSDYTKLISESIEEIFGYTSQLEDTMPKIEIIDLAPFPLFGLLMLKKGAHSLVCVANDKEDKKFFKQILRSYKIPPTKVKILTAGSLNPESHQTMQIFTGKKFHCIFSNIIELCGELNVEQSKLTNYLRLNHLVRGGVILPLSITLEAQLVNSHWLDIHNRVYDENVSNYKVAMFLNKYQVSQNIHVELHTLEYEAISKPVAVDLVRNKMESQVINLPIEKDGDASAVLVWYRLRLTENGRSITTKTPTSYIDGMVYLANPPVRQRKGGIGNILCCANETGMFKLLIDRDN